jgi:hypothetical protein
LWEPDQFGEWQNTCFGCGDDECCHEPGTEALPSLTAFGTETTPCVPLPDPFPSSSSAMLAAPYAIPPASAKALLRLPDVNDPSRWHSFVLAVSKPWRFFQKADLGWMVTILRTPDGPASPVMAPTTIPAASTKPADKALCASIVLPETRGPTQYWVHVLETYRWSQLQTPEWTVFFLRLPLP